MSIQITGEELAKVVAINDRYNALYVELGQNTVKTKAYLALLEELDTEAKNLHKDYEHLVEEHEAIGKLLSEKYGDGVLDLQSGTISTQ